MAHRILLLAFPFYPLLSQELLQYVFTAHFSFAQILPFLRWLVNYVRCYTSMLLPHAALLRKITYTLFLTATPLHRSTLSFSHVLKLLANCLKGNAIKSRGSFAFDCPFYNWSLILSSRYAITVRGSYAQNCVGLLTLQLSVDFIQRFPATPLRRYFTCLSCELGSPLISGNTNLSSLQQISDSFSQLSTAVGKAIHFFRNLKLYVQQSSKGGELDN